MALSDSLPQINLGVQDGTQVNMNGKKMEIIVKKIINKMPYNADNIINPESLKNFIDVPELQPIQRTFTDILQIKE
ncbi:hypothetical protein TNCV_4358871 [Trichonephila clavipes]|nr:hypothetical protein TNCV_36161 [Trichonephila clavipes]GFW39892.1 hypothetical protein TNCV_4358871 [Trichonephila clavipes]